MLMTILYLESTDPAFNLAAEQYFMLEADGDYFFFWRNERSVIVGRNQNTASEIDSEFVKQHGIKVVRRLSGGGAVFHDLGNINYTYITGAGQEEKIDFAKYSFHILRLLESFGVDAELSGRNDLIVDGCKVSGAAQYVKNGRLLHHGTLLFCADLREMQGALCAKPEKYVGKAAKSVRSRVTNLRDRIGGKYTAEEFIAALTLAAQIEFPDAAVRGLTDGERGEIERIANEVYRSRDWNYGRSPAFSFNKTMRFPYGTIECHFEANKGRIAEVQLRGDFFGVLDIEELEKRLAGEWYDRESIEKVLLESDIDQYIHGASAQEITELFF